MTNIHKLFHIVLLALMTQTVSADCLFQPSVSAFMKDAYYAQLVDANNYQRVIVQVGPIGPGQYKSTRFECPSFPIRANYINSRNAMYQYLSTNSVIISNNMRAFCSLDNSFSYQLIVG